MWKKMTTVALWRRCRLVRDYFAIVVIVVCAALARNVASMSLHCPTGLRPTGKLCGQPMFMCADFEARCVENVCCTLDNFTPYSGAIASMGPLPYPIQQPSSLPYGGFASWFPGTMHYAPLAAEYAFNQQRSCADHSPLCAAFAPSCQFAIVAEICRASCGLCSPIFMPSIVK